MRAKAEARVSELGLAGVWVPPESVALLSWHLSAKVRADVASGRPVAPAVVEIADAARRAMEFNRGHVVARVDRPPPPPKRKR